MTDDDTADDFERAEQAQNTGTLSRRQTLASLLGVGSLGLTGTGTGLGTTTSRQIDVTREDEYVVEVNEERGLRLGSSGSFAVEDRQYTAGGNVLFGHLNEIRTGVLGAAIGGGGMHTDYENTPWPNVVADHFGTVSGGAGNEAGNEDEEPRNALFATVGGGLRNRARGTRSTVGGGDSNEATGGRATVGGGINNEATDDAATVGGGIGNDAEGTYATVAGGGGNVAEKAYAAVGGGRGNNATGKSATIAGGRSSRATGERATVGGGYYNRAHGYGATIPGGSENIADGEYSFAAGYEADTNGHDGAFVFADSAEESFRADADDTAYFQMPIHAPSFNTTSTRTAKTDRRPVDTDTVLDGVSSLDIEEWSFDDGDGDRHLGPMAEDFQATFGLGGDDTTIASVDADGVALAAIQGLQERLESKEKRIEELEEKVAKRDERLERLESRLSRLEAETGDGTG
jgi:hypothetical protein